MILDNLAQRFDLVISSWRKTPGLSHRDTSRGALAGVGAIFCVEPQGTGLFLLDVKNGPNPCAECAECDVCDTCEVLLL